MDRYGVAPPKPKMLAKATLNRLSDPVKGKHMDENESPQRARVVRDTKMHPRRQNKPVVSRHRSSSRNAAPPELDGYDHSPIRKQAWSESPQKHPPRPQASPRHDHGGDGDGGGGGGEGGGFFITGVEEGDGGEDYGDEDFESPPPSPAALRRRMQQAQQQPQGGPEVSPIGMGLVGKSPAGRDRGGAYSPPDIYSPRTKEALRKSFSHEQQVEAAAAPPKKTFNPLQFAGKHVEETAGRPSRATKVSSLGAKQPKQKQGKLVKGKAKPKTTAKAAGGRTASKTRDASAGRAPRGSSLERNSKAGLRRSARRAPVGDDLTFEAPSRRVQLLSNKMQAASRSSRGDASSSLLRSSSVKGARSSSTGRDGLGGSRSAPTLPRGRAGQRGGEDDERLPSIQAHSSSKPASLPALRAKNLLGRKGVSPALQERYADILHSSREASKLDPPPGGKTAGHGFGASSGTGRSRTKTLQPIVEKQDSGRQKSLPANAHNVDKKLKNREAVKQKQKQSQEDVRSPAGLTAEEKERRRAEEQSRREEQEKRIEARMVASKKKDEMEYRNKIRQQAEESAAKARSQDANYETVDEKLVLMFKTHCARLNTKLSEADKLSADFRALKEFDGYSSSDRQNLRADRDRAGATKAEAGGDAFLSKQLMM